MLRWHRVICCFVSHSWSAHGYLNSRRIDMSSPEERTLRGLFEDLSKVLETHMKATLLTKLHTRNCEGRIANNVHQTHNKHMKCLAPRCLPVVCCAHYCTPKTVCIVSSDLNFTFLSQDHQRQVWKMIVISPKMMHAVRCSCVFTVVCVYLHCWVLLLLQHLTSPLSQSPSPSI